MASRNRTTGKGRGKRSVASASSRSRRPARKAAGTARKSATRRGAGKRAAPREMKLVIETRSASPVSRLDGVPQVETKKGKAKL